MRIGRRTGRRGAPEEEARRGGPQGGELLAGELVGSGVGSRGGEAHGAGDGDAGGSPQQQRDLRERQPEHEQGEVRQKGGPPQRGALSERRAVDASDREVSRVVAWAWRRVDRHRETIVQPWVRKRCGQRGNVHGQRCEMFERGGLGGNSEKCHRCGGEELADVEQDEEEEAQRQREGAREETARQR